MKADQITPKLKFLSFFSILYRAASCHCKALSNTKGWHAHTEDNGFENIKKKISHNKKILNRLSTIYGF